MQDSLLDITPFKKIYGPAASLAAIWIGGPVAAVYIFLSNRKSLDRPRHRLLAWPLALLGVLALMYLSIIYPLNQYFPWFYLKLNTLLAFCFIVRFWTPAYKEHLGRLGSLYSWWTGVGVGLICLLITFLIVMLGIMANDSLQVVR